MSTKPIRVDAAAADEIEAAVAWYEARRQGLGSELLDELDRTSGLVENNSSSFARVESVRPTLGVRRSLLRRFPFARVFLELTHDVRILARAHTWRRPGYWRGR